MLRHVVRRGTVRALGIVSLQRVLVLWILGYLGQQGLKTVFYWDGIDGALERYDRFWVQPWHWSYESLNSTT